MFLLEQDVPGCVIIAQSNLEPTIITSQMESANTRLEDVQEILSPERSTHVAPHKEDRYELLLFHNYYEIILCLFLSF